VLNHTMSGSSSADQVALALEGEQQLQRRQQQQQADMAARGRLGPTARPPKVKNTFYHFDVDGEGDGSDGEQVPGPYRHARGSLTLSPNLCPGLVPPGFRPRPGGGGQLVAEAAPDPADLEMRELSDYVDTIGGMRWSDVAVSPIMQPTTYFPGTPEREHGPLEHFDPAPVPSLPTWTWDKATPMGGLLPTVAEWAPLQFAGPPPSVAGTAAGLFGGPLAGCKGGKAGKSAGKSAAGKSVAGKSAGKGSLARQQLGQQQLQPQPHTSARPVPPGPSSVQPSSQPMSQAEAMATHVMPIQQHFGSATGTGGLVMFKITLRRADGVALGLEVERVMQDRALLVRGVSKGGAVDSWNKQCGEGQAQWKAVLQGDKIVQANDALGCEGILEQIKNKLLLTLQVVRETAQAAGPPPPPLAGQAMQVCLQNQLGF